MDRRSRQAPQRAATGLDGAHHIATGEPGQGVDGPLLCPVINKPGLNPTFPEPLRLRQNVFGGSERMASSQSSGPSYQPKVETRLVTAGRDAQAQRGFVNPPVVHGS